MVAPKLTKAAPKHCKGCVFLTSHNGARESRSGGVENAWCCAHGGFANKSISWCKTHDAKKLKGPT